MPPPEPSSLPSRHDSVVSATEVKELTGGRHAGRIAWCVHPASRKRTNNYCDFGFVAEQQSSLVPPHTNHAASLFRRSPSRKIKIRKQWTVHALPLSAFDSYGGNERTAVRRRSSGGGDHNDRGCGYGHARQAAQDEDHNQNNQQRT